MKIHKLDELSTQLIQPTVQVRVSRLWEAVYDGKTLHLDMILIDDKNNDIWAQIPRTLEKMFKSKIQEQKIYIMEKFKVMPATGGYRPVQNKLIIQFTSSTVVQEIPEIKSIPKYKFSFATEAYVNSHIDQSKQLTDVLGAVIHKEETRMLRWGTKSTPMKNIKLQFTEYGVSLHNSLSRKRSEYTIAKIMDEASNSGEMVDKEQKDGLLVAHSSSESLSSCCAERDTYRSRGRPKSLHQGH